MMHWLWYTLPVVSLPGVERLLRGRLPEVVELIQAQTVLAVAAHPDDLEYFCGGTLGRLSSEGIRVVTVIATRGEMGGDPAVRAAEQTEAARVLGYSGLYLLSFPDGMLRSEDEQLRQALLQLIDQERPDLVLTFDDKYPFPVYQHPDHMAVARAILDLWRGPALLFHTRRPDLVVDITYNFAAKVKAFGAHRSQLPRWGAPHLAGFHLRRRFASGRRRYLEPFRRRIPPPPGDDDSTKDRMVESGWRAAGSPCEPPG